MNARLRSIDMCDRRGWVGVCKLEDRNKAERHRSYRHETVHIGKFSASVEDVSCASLPSWSTDRISELGFEPLLSPGAAGLVVVGLKGVVVLGGQDHGVQLPRLFDDHRFSLGLGRQTTESLIGFSG